MLLRTAGGAPVSSPVTHHPAGSTTLLRMLRPAGIAAMFSFNTGERECGSGMWLHRRGRTRTAKPRNSRTAESDGREWMAPVFRTRVQKQWMSEGVHESCDTLTQLRPAFLD